MICPILNQECKCEKNNHMVEISKNKMTWQGYVCDECPFLESKRKKPVSDEYIFTKEDLFKALKPLAIKKCPKCLMTLEDYSKTKLLGCENCYSYFKDHIQSKKYNGKIPKTQAKSILMKRLEMAVVNERYEEANEIKKRLLDFE